MSLIKAWGCGFLLLVFATSASAVEVKVTPIPEQIAEMLMQECAESPRPELEVIKDIKVSKSLLADRVDWTKQYFEFGNAKGELSSYLSYSSNVEETGGDPPEFIAYYPGLGIISFSDFFGGAHYLDLNSGEEIHDNPEVRVYSPSGQYRVTTYYNGMDTDVFLQHKQNGSWVRGTPEYHLALAPSLSEACWIDKLSLIIKAYSAPIYTRVDILD